MDECAHREYVNLRERVARLEAQHIAMQEAVKITATNLDSYKAGSNEWRQALNDQRILYATRNDVITIVSLMLLVVGSVVGIIGLIIRATT